MKNKQNVQNHDKNGLSCHYIHVLCTTLGHYIYFVQPPSVLALSKEEMCSLMVDELTTGCVEQPDVKCGFIGEVGSGWPLHGGFNKTAMEYIYFSNAFFVLLHTSLDSIFNYYKYRSLSSSFFVLFFLNPLLHLLLASFLVLFWLMWEKSSNSSAF